MKTPILPAQHQRERERERETERDRERQRESERERDRQTEITLERVSFMKISDTAFFKTTPVFY